MFRYLVPGAGLGSARPLTRTADFKGYGRVTDPCPATNFRAALNEPLTIATERDAVIAQSASHEAAAFGLEQP